MTLLDKIQTAIFGHDDTPSVQESEAAYQMAKARYDLCVSRKDKRGQGEAFKALNKALTTMLRAHSAASRRHTHRARFSARSRPARAE